MKILYIITQADIGGAQKYVLDLALAFNGAIACGTEKNHLFAEARKLGIQTFGLKFLRRDINPIFDLLALAQIFFLVKKLQPDIVHLNSSKAGILGSIAAKLGGAKTVFTAHGFSYNQPWNKFKKAVYLQSEKFASKFRDVIITISQTDQRSALENNIAPPWKLKTIYNGIDELGFLSPKQAKMELGLPADALSAETLIVGSIAQLYHTKGLDILLEAIASLPDKQVKPNKSDSENLFFVIIGDGPLMAQLQEQASRLNIAGQIKFTGAKKQASQYLKVFDIFVLPSRIEGFSYALLEAMQAGLPIIATDVGGNKEALADAAIIVAPNQPESLRQAILELTESEKRQLLAEKSLQRSKNFSKQEMLAKTADIYSQLRRHT